MCYDSVIKEVTTVRVYIFVYLVVVTSCRLVLLFLFFLPVERAITQEPMVDEFLLIYRPFGSDGFVRAIWFLGDVAILLEIGELIQFARIYRYGGSVSCIEVITSSCLLLTKLDCPRTVSCPYWLYSFHREVREIK